MIIRMSWCRPRTGREGRAGAPRDNNNNNNNNNTRIHCYD